MKKIILAAVAIVSISTFKAQTFIQAYQNRVNQISQTNINTLLQEFSDFGIKTTGSVNNNNTFNWLKGKYQSFGYSNTQIEEQSFTYNGNTTKNLIITKTGTLYPNTFVIVCGHFDTINGPGANDNGSGTSVLLEAARILKDVSTEYSIKFIHFSGEEQGLLGSQKYVNDIVNATNPKMNIRLVFNLDQVGGKIGNTNTSIKCERDESSPSANNAASNTKTQELMNCVTLYSPLQPVLSNAYSSDYVPFQNNGEIITGFYENTRSYVEHTANDTFANVDKTFVYNVGKAAIGAIQHFAIANTNLGVMENGEITPKFSVVPNPAKDTIQLIFDGIKNSKFKFFITDLSGKQVMKLEDKKEIDISELPNGVYLGTLTTDKFTITEKIIVEK